MDDISSEMLKLRDIGEEELFKITYMNESDIRNLFVKGHIIGCHGHTHTPFSNLNDKELSAELKTNISILEGIIQREISWISYPYGMKWSVPQNSDKVWVDLGLRMGFNLDKEDTGWNNGVESPFWVKRINCNFLESFT